MEGSNAGVVVISLEESRGSGRGTRRRDGELCLLVDAHHLGHLGLLILITVLDDAKRIDPDVPQAHAPGDLKSVFDRLGQLAVREFLLVLAIPFAKRLEDLVSSPAVTQSAIVTFSPAGLAQPRRFRLAQGRHLNESCRQIGGQVYGTLVVASEALVHPLACLGKALRRPKVLEQRLRMDDGGRWIVWGDFINMNSLQPASMPQLTRRGVHGP